MTPRTARTVRVLDELIAPDEPAPAVDLLDAVVAGTPAPSDAGRGSALDAFLTAASTADALSVWLGGSPPVAATAAEARHAIATRLGRDIARIDALLGEQVDAILHHPAFQRLEASWRGLYFLVGQVPEGENIKLRVLSATWKELVRDQERAIEFDQSVLFRKVYSEEFGTPGGEPFGLLIGDYEVRHRPSAEHPMDDLAALQGIAGVAAGAFAPFVAGAHPSLLELDAFTDLESVAEAGRPFTQLEYLKWKAFRQTEDARFVGLALPRVLMRLPHADDPHREDGFRYREDVSAPDRSGYLWGNAAFAFGAVAIRAFAETAWLADVRGARRGEAGGGVVAGLPAHRYAAGGAGPPRSLTDAHVTDAQEKELADLGFLPLCHCPDTDLAAFYSAASLQQPKRYDEPAARANARLMSMLHYTLCSSRFAHYVKVIVRDRLGAFTGPSECEDGLRRWLQNFIVSNDNASAEMKARYPLREGRVQVQEVPGKPGSYRCVMHLRPHFQLDQLSAGIRLTTEVNTHTGP